MVNELVDGTNEPNVRSLEANCGINIELMQYRYIPGLLARKRIIVYPPSGTVTVSLATGSTRFLNSFPCSSSRFTSLNKVVSPS